MPEITIPKEMYTRVVEFKPVIEAVIEEEIDFDTCVEMVIGQGIDAMLGSLLGSLEPSILLRSFQQLGAQHPEQVYQYVAETMKQGAIAQEQQEVLKRRMGFATSEATDSEAQ